MKPSINNDLIFDYIIVGAGTAGCLLANRLSADASKRVLLIEAGGKDDYHWVHIPIGYLKYIGNPRTDWCYQTALEPALNQRSIRYPRGKILGGNSSINGMLYMRGQARDYEQWAEITGDDRWRWKNCLNFFTLHEDHHGGANEYHGAKGVPHELLLNDKTLYGEVLRHHNAGGEWRVEKQRLQWDILNAFEEAAVQAGIPRTADFNRGDNEGIGYFEVNQKNGFRWNTAKAFVRPKCFGRPNFELWTHAHVTQLILNTEDSVTCDGVEVWNGREKIITHARRAVILCSGSIGTPQILQLSGIGPAELLRHYGITPKVDLQGVGANLQDHLQIRSVYKIKGAPTLNSIAASPWGRFKIGLEYALKQTGPLSMAPSQLCAFTRSDPQQVWPNLQYHIQPLSLPAFGEPLDRFSALTASVCNLHPTSRGSVRINSPDFSNAPTIAPNYLSTPIDQKIALDAIAVTRKILAQPALVKYSPSEYRPGLAKQDSDDLLGAIGDIATTIFHPVGSAKMGPAKDPMAVVDSLLRVFNGKGGVIKGLCIADASVMPTITSGNTNSPVLMIAEQLAYDLIHDAHKNEPPLIS